MGAEDRSSPRSARDTLHDADRAAALSETLSSEEVPLDEPDRPTDPSEHDPRADEGATTDPDRASEADGDPFGDLSTGSELGGRYRLERILGKGATGVVFEASHLVIGKRVAVKCLYPHHRATPNAVERFFREARIAATVEHPNVIQVFDGGDERDTLFLTMELLKGESLGDRLERGPLSLSRAVDLFLAIMDGVAAVHELGVVHRDLKPDNIFLVDPRRPEDPPVPKVLDFGISKLKEPGLRELTTLGTVMGTPFYMAPEQIANTRDVDARADVYSLGVMLYEALAGGVPYAGDSVLEIFKAAQTGGAPPLRERRPDAPEALAELVHRAMAPERDDRWPGVRQMCEALRQIAIDEAPSPDDVRSTVRDVDSPLRAYEERMRRQIAEGTRAPPKPAGVASRAAERPRPEDRPTVPPAATPAMPRWGWVALGASAGLTLLSVIAAALALIL
ncbi:MAG TPA: serine/threonine-protein kinase [Sandaracinaceae bacterium LLY-WYZ-13_1]|nr:serine/threonine-protein kinase [Sandaracinaceae bacterium LLY-WYZ-13_1]